MKKLIYGYLLDTKSIFNVCTKSNFYTKVDEELQKMFYNVYTKYYPKFDMMNNNAQITSNLI